MKTLDELRKSHTPHAGNIVSEPRPDCPVCHGQGEYPSEILDGFVDVCFCTYGPDEETFNFFLKHREEGELAIKSIVNLFDHLLGG